jgi:hypothetical protein
MATIGNRIMQKLCKEFCCEKCNYKTVRKSRYDTHLLSAKHQSATNGNGIMQKLCKEFCCEKCNYKTVRKSSYDTHLLSAKHQSATNGNELSNTYDCDVCNKCYKDRTGLWRHKKKCIEIVKSEEQESDELSDKELIIALLKQNAEQNRLNAEQTAEQNRLNAEQNAEQNRLNVEQTAEQNRLNAELHTKMIELCKNGITNNNTINNTTNNKTFNLQIYLNETCKDAVNLEEFGKETVIQLSDLDKIGRVGFVDGMTDIIETRFKTLDVNKRPIHCTDAKREVFYVKDNDKWEKDEGNKKMRRLILRTDRKLAPMLLLFGQNHTNLGYLPDSEIIKHQKIVHEILGGKDDDDTNAAAIIRRLSKKMLIEKHF